MGVLANRISGLRAVWHFDNCCQLVLNRLLFRQTGLTVYTIRGRDLVVDHHGDDENGLRLCITSDMYTKYLEEMRLSDGIVVLDLGANCGGFPLMLELAGITIKKLVCVEMNPNTATRLSFNVARNLNCDFRIINAAACGERQEFELFLGRGNTSDSIYKTSNGAETAGRKCTIRGITLDDLKREHFADDEVVDLCKMDIEGAEYDILSSPTHSLLRTVRYLIIEIHKRPGHSQVELIEKLKELGFIEVEVAGTYKEQDVHMYRNTNF